MKKLLIAAMLIVFCFSSCDDESESKADSTPSQLMDSIEENSVLLDSALARTTALLKGGELVKRTIEEAGKKQEFILEMNSVIENVFDSVLKQKSVKKQSPGLSIEQQDDLLSVIVKSEENHINAYALKIKSNVDKKAGKDDWIAIESYSWPSATAGPTEHVSLNYSKMVHIFEIYELIMTHQETADLDNAIDLHIKSNEDTRVAIGLLLPAVQMAREAARRHTSLMDVVFSDKVFDEKPADMPVLLQEQRAAAFLGGVNRLISEDFDSTNEKTASTDVLRSIYENMMTELWSQTWDHAHN
jgi:hypothetical protein